MTAPAFQVTVNTGDFDDAPGALLTEGVRTTLIGEGHGAGEMSVTLLDDEGIRQLNHQYLGKDAVTDVIAFSLGDDAVLGDVYVGVPQARRQAEEYEVPLTEELLRLVIHGTLHVVGHEHPEGPERTESAMYRLQERYLGETLLRAAEETS